MNRLAACVPQHLALFALGAMVWGCSAAPCLAALSDLHARYASLESQLNQSPFHRPLLLVSVEAGGRLTGDIDAVVDHPFALVRANLSSPDHWCDVMILHINTKHCTAGSAGSADAAELAVNVSIGKKTPEVLTDAMRISFSFAVLTSTPDNFEVMLSAKKGPLGTSDYRLRLQAIALSNARTYVRLSYSYAANMLGRVAMQTYLNTLGRGKVGFTSTGNGPDRQPVYIEGMRALVERNAMRYYLAIDSYLKFPGEPKSSQVEKRLQAWYSAIEQYPRQLHEVERADYMQMKRAEVLRQQTVQ